MNKSIPKSFNPLIKHILIVDDDKDVRTVMMIALSKSGFECEQASDAETAYERITRQSFDLVISDIEMPGMDGIELLKKIKSVQPDLDVIIMTGYAARYTYVDIMNAGAADYMSKPVDISSMRARINRIAREKETLLNLKKSNQELCVAIQRANRLALEAREASKAKTFFLASMSHEIRTPLNGIVGYTDMLMDTVLDEEQKSFLKHAKLSCEALLSVVNDILDFSKVEAGKLNLEHIGFDPEVLCFDAIDMVRTKVDETRVELICSVSDAVPGMVKGDPHRFRQILLNLLGNAIKFTDKGSIILELDVVKNDTDGDLLVVCVKDTGIGIAEDKLQSIFQPFIQSEDDITHRYGGTGLGLAISKNIAGKMGGDVWAEKNEKKGACFYFTSQLTAIPNKPVKRVEPAQLKDKKVLFSSLSPETRKILTHEFKFVGMSVTTVEFSNLAAYLKTREKACFDIAVIDFGKRVKNDKTHRNFEIEGVDLKQFKFGFIACSIPIPGVADRFARAGFKGYLPKPVPRKKIFEMMAYVMGMDNRPVDGNVNDAQIITSHSMSENKKHGISILLVEDNLVNQKMTRLMLTKAGYTIDIAENGLEAVETYTRMPDVYDLIFMDINMPVLDGFEATRRIRQFERQEQDRARVTGNRPIRRVPILALTANVLDDFKLKCIDCGMDAFLSKPIKRDLVFQAIHKFTRTDPPVH